MKFEVAKEQPQSKENDIVMWLKQNEDGVTLFACKKGSCYDARKLAKIGESGIRLCPGVQGYLGIAIDEKHGHIKLIS